MKRKDLEKLAPLVSAKARKQTAALTELQQARRNNQKAAEEFRHDAIHNAGEQGVDGVDLRRCANYRTARLKQARLKLSAAESLTPAINLEMQKLRHESKREMAIDLIRKQLTKAARKKAAAHAEEEISAIAQLQRRFSKSEY